MATTDNIRKALFPDPKTLYTTVGRNEFELEAVTETGIKLRVPLERGGSQAVVLDYGRLDALWRSRGVVECR